ncbi:DUF6916 family protein [Tahibacter harae]|uniref:DUF6916 domain-containing protein n=1 Tax=Tahibacter harae TaxID=2963937 RepID=A0ABT1QUX4_9GAMM|nr:hypothetical protein [Tahibacter harae]MCQ4166068.1 hypothetical protein [Tahibacter harae]
MLDQLKLEDFQPLVGHSLNLGDGTSAVALELTEARALKSPSPRSAPSFALILRQNGAQQSFGQGLYRLEHPSLGPLDLFVVPIGPDGAGMCYEITFN